MPLQIRRGTEAERLILAAPLVEGELLWITDDQKLYIGNGTTPANTLSPVTGYDDNDAVSAVADAFAAGSQTGISFSYNGIDALSATVSYPLLNLDGTIKAHVLPDADETYDLGSAGSKFRDLYLSGTSLYLGTAQITASGSAVNLPAGSTIDGISIASIASGVVEGSNYRINVVGNDSSLIVDSDTNSITANNVTVTGNITGYHIGDMTGSVFGDDSTKIVDAVNNIVSADEINANSTLSCGFLSLTGGQLSSTEDILFTSASGLFRYDCIGSQPDLAEGLGDSIVAAVNSFTGIDLNAVPPDLSSSFVAGDITSTIKFVSFDPTRAYRSVVLGAQIDKTAFTESYAPSKFFLIVFNQEDRDLEEDETVEDVIRYVTYDPYGRFGVGRENAKATLDINGFMKLKVLSTEPTVVEDASIPDGFVAIADGVNWDPLSNGRQSMVVRLGGTWVQMAVAP